MVGVLSTPWRPRQPWLPVASAAVCAAVGALAVASTCAALACEVLKLEIVALNDLRHGGAKEEVLSVVVQLHHAQQQLGASRRRLCRELARARED